MSVLQWKIKGYNTHKDFLTLLMKEQNPYAICIQETHLKENKFNSPPRNYNTFFKNRANQDKAFGDVAIFTNNSIPATQIAVNTNLEAIAVTQVLYAIKQEVPKRALGSNEQPGSAKKSRIQLLGISITQHASLIATVAGKKLGYLFRARKYFSPSNLFTLYKVQIRPSLEYCSHICGAAAPTTLSILDTIRLIGNPALTCHLQPLSHRRAIGDLSLF
nr:unnamed protein product [Callosobruchus chinensis]